MLSIRTCEGYLRVRLAVRHEELHRVDQLAAANDVPDAILTCTGLKLTRLDATVPQAAQNLIEQIAASLPHVKITGLLLETDNWTGFYKELHSPEEWRRGQGPDTAPDMTLADAINLGLTKMTESCPGTSYAKLSWQALMHLLGFRFAPRIRDLSDTKLSFDRQGQIPGPGARDRWDHQPKAIRMHWNEILRLATSIRRAP